jgi:hypothetical protein
MTDDLITDRECNASRQVLEGRIFFIDQRVNGVESDVEEIRECMKELREEIRVDNKVLRDEFKLFQDGFNSKLVTALVIIIVILVSVIMGKSVDFGWIVGR